MAILFMITADCGHDRKCAEAIVEHFANIRFELSDGNSIGFSHDASNICTRGDVIWCRSIPDGVSAGGPPQQVSTTAARVELAKLIHAELRLLKGYRFALVGWEAASGPDWSEILEAASSIRSLPSGLIINDDLHRRLGCPGEFERFGGDTWWLRLSDEDYADVMGWGSSE